MSIHTTAFEQLSGQKPPAAITLYGPDGVARQYAPVDAREILASDAGYTAEARVIVGGNLDVEQFMRTTMGHVTAQTAQKEDHEQQPEQQSITGDTSGTETQDQKEADAPPVAVASAVRSKAARGKK